MNKTNGLGFYVVTHSKNSEIWSPKEVSIALKLKSGKNLSKDLSSLGKRKFSKKKKCSEVSCSDKRDLGDNDPMRPSQ